MLDPQEIKAVNAQRTAAIAEKFIPLESPKSELTKSVQGEQLGQHWTAEDLSQYKEDLFKGIDAGTITDDQLEKAQEELLSLTKATTVIDGVEKEVFIKG